MDVPGYTDLVPLGRGGFSTVYRARQLAVDRDVALKVLAVDLVDETARNRFRRECATNGRVGAHPAVVTVYDSGFTGDGHPFLSMQLCPGGSLADALRARGPLPVNEVLHAGVSIAAALAYAHSVGVLHRDIKPENILLSQFGEPLLADFGIATVDDQRVSTMTAASFTINHAAPECLAGAAPSPAADVYGLSSTLYTLLAGHPPFVAGTAAALVSLVSMVMNDPVPPLNRPDVPRSLNDLLVAGMAKNPAGRPPDATAFGRGLQAVQSELGLPVTPWPAAPAGSAAGAAGAAAAGPGAVAGMTGASGVRPGGPPGGTLAGTAPMASPFTTGNPAVGPVSPTGTAAGTGMMPGTGATAGAGVGITPVLMPEEILPFAPSDPTRMGAVGPAAGSMTMVAGPGVRPAGSGPGGPAGPGGPGIAAGPGAGSSGPGRRSRTGVAVALTAAAVVIAIGVGAVLFFLAGRNDREGAGAGPGATGTTDASQTVSDTATTSTSPSSSTETSVTTTETTPSTSSVSSTEFGATEATVAPPPASSLTVPTTTHHDSPPVTKTVVVTTTKQVPRPSIDTFEDMTVDHHQVDCSGGDSVVQLAFIWSASNATTAWFGIDSGPDASAAPFESDLPPVVGPSSSEMSEFDAPFACGEQQHTYTLTVSGPGGKTSKSLVYTRAPMPTDNPTSTP